MLEQLLNGDTHFTDSSSSLVLLCNNQMFFMSGVADSLVPDQFDSTVQVGDNYI